MRKMIHERKRSLKRKIFIMSCIVIVLSVMFLGSVAYLQRISMVENQFEIGETTIKVEENFNEAKTQKTDIYLVNEGNISAYMRAKVLLYYVDVENNILCEKDLKRQHEIIDHLHCEFWRYNESIDVLYKVT